MNNISKYGTAIPEFCTSKHKAVDKPIQENWILPDEEIFDPRDDLEDDSPKIDKLFAVDEEGDNVEDFSCAILREKIQIPGMLSCGHFFELQQIDAFREFNLKKSLPFACPKGCQNIQNKIIESKQLKNGIEKSHKKIAALRKENLELKSSKSDLELRFSEFQSELSDIMEVKFESMFKLKSTKLFDQSKKISKYSKKISEISSKISEQNDLLEEKNKIRKKQIENATPKNLIGRVSFCLWPDSVLNHGITSEEQGILKIKSLSDQEKENLEKELDDLTSKMEKLELGVGCLYECRTQSYNIEDKRQSAILEFKEKKHQKSSGLEIGLALPRELIVSIFDHFAVEENPLEGKSLRHLLQCAQVCRQWNSIAEECFSNFFLKIMKNKEKQEGMSWAQSLGILYNWKNQTKRVTFLATLQPSQAAFLPVDCHLPLDNQGLVYDKIEIGSLRVLLSSRTLLGTKVQTVDSEKKTSSILWRQAIENPEKHIFVSTEQKLIATQHYYSLKSKGDSPRMICRFDVRHLHTGQLMGNVEILYSENKKIFNPTNVQFDLKKFMYQEGKQVKTRYYDPCLIAL